jgi:hypothetical protein
MPDTLTWAALLARWTEFAASSVALPDSGEPGRWKRAVPQIITLQSVTHALAEVGELDLAEIPVALDRAAVSVREAVGALADIWSGEALPPEAFELCEDAELALGLAESIGLEWVVESASLVAMHPGEVLEALAESELISELLIATPRVTVQKQSPAAHLRPACWNDEVVEAAAEMIDAFLNIGGEVAIAGFGPQRQVYRQFDFAKGGPVRDLVAPTALGMAAGQPLLVPGISGGQVCPVTLGPRAGMKLDPIPVVFAESRDDL